MEQQIPVEKQEDDKEYLGWEGFDAMIHKLSKEIQESYEPDVIIALFRGGAIPGTYLSHLLKVRDMRPLLIKRTKSNEANAQMIAPEASYMELLQGITGKNILIVDDIADYGASLKKAQDEVAKLNPQNVKSVVLVTNPGHLNLSKDRPQIDFVGIAADKWIVFPWEDKT